MPDLPRLDRPLPRLLLGAAGLLALASPAGACENTASSLDWDHCWSALRVGLWLLSLVPAVGLSYLTFRSLLEPGRPRPPWPRTAFGRALALWWGLGGLSFLVLFGGLSDELRRPGWRLLPPGWFGNFINLNWLLLLAVAVTAGGAWLILRAVRHPEKVV